jgi:hypothetical protein
VGRVVLLIAALQNATEIFLIDVMHRMARAQRINGSSLGFPVSAVWNPESRCCRDDRRRLSAGRA